MNKSDTASVTRSSQPLTVPDYNREAANQVVQCVRDGKYCALLGPRFAGKSDLLRFVQAELERDPSYMCVYIDLRAVEASTQSGFFANLINVTTQSAQGAPIPTVDVFNGVVFRSFLESTLTLIKRDLVLAVDRSLYAKIEGHTDTEVLFFLALTFGLEDDPPPRSSARSGSSKRWQPP